MSHAYTRYCRSFAYVGRHAYSLTFVTRQRRPVFKRADVVDAVSAQLVRAATERDFEILVYCFMPDHLHLVALGLTHDAGLKTFVTLAKQYAGYEYARSHAGARLWQHGSNDHIIRNAADLLDRVRYVVSNPVVAGLAGQPGDYPFLRSERQSLGELIDWCRTGELPGFIDLQAIGLDR